MATFKIKVSNKVLDRFLNTLKQFNSNDIQIVQEFVNVEEAKRYVQESLTKLESDESQSISVEELAERLERIIKELESSAADIQFFIDNQGFLNGFENFSSSSMGRSVRVSIKATKACIWV